MNRRVFDRLASLAMAFVVTFGLASGIHNLAAAEAAEAVNARHLAQSAAVPACARV